MLRSVILKYKYANITHTIINRIFNVPVALDMTHLHSKNQFIRTPLLTNYIYNLRLSLLYIWHILWHFHKEELEKYPFVFIECLNILLSTFKMNKKF